MALLVMCVFPARPECQAAALTLVYNFRIQDYERVVNLFKNNYSIPVDTKETSLRGWNWGKADVTGSDLAFSVGGKTAWTIPIEQIHNTTINKTEVILEFNQPDVGGGVKKKQLPDEMVEMRVFIPGSESRARKKAKKAERQAEKQGKAKKEDDQEEEEVDTDDVSSDEGEGIEDGTTAAQVFHDTIKDRADIGKIQGDSIMSFNEVHHVTPRCALLSRLTNCSDCSLHCLQRKIRS